MDDPKASLAEVARLTRLGRVKEAMALLKLVVPAAPRPTIAAPTLASAANLLKAAVPRDLAKVFGSRLPGVNGALREDTDHGKQGRADAGLVETHRFSNASGRRDYKLYRPSQTDGTPMPLVVMLHGCQQSPDDFAAGTRMNVLADEQGFLVAYPGQPSSANPSRCWNWFNAGDQMRDKGEPSLLAGITQQVMQQADVDPARVYVAGLSAGGAEAAILGASYPELFAAVCVHSGLACGAARDMSSAFSAMRQGGMLVAPGAGRPVPTIVFHGDGDHTVNPVNGDQVIAQARAGSSLQSIVTEGRSAGGMRFTKTVQVDAQGRPVLEQWVLHGAGHAWSGGSAAGSYTDPRGPDASREMLRFFAEQGRVPLQAAAE